MNLTTEQLSVIAVALKFYCENSDFSTEYAQLDRRIAWDLRDAINLHFQTLPSSAEVQP